MKHILVVDDNLKNLEMTARILREEGYRISLAQDGGAALKNMEENIPDLILLDIMMPGMDGLEFCRVIKGRERFADIPVIFLSAKNQTEDLTEGFKAGGVDYITKPFKQEELLLRVRNHLELKESRERILRMNRNRDRLYSIIAHDLRAPFSSISFTIESIAGGYVDPCSEKFMGIVRQLDKTVNETQSLLENLLLWTKLSSESLVPYPEKCNLTAIAERCHSLFERYLRNKTIDLILESDPMVFAFCDEVTIYTVIRNLISNALKFTHEGGTIKVNLKQTRENAIVNVSDNGKGMTEEMVSRIRNDAEPFTTSGTNNEKGSGLGYLLIKDFVSLNNGWLDIESAPGAGTSVSVYLPAVKS